MTWYSIFAEIKDASDDLTFYRLYSKKVDFDVHPLGIVLATCFSGKSYPDNSVYSLACSDELLGNFKGRLSTPLDIQQVIAVSGDVTDTRLAEIKRNYSLSLIVPEKNMQSKLLLTASGEFMLLRDGFDPNVTYRISAQTVGGSRKKVLGKHTGFKILTKDGEPADDVLLESIVREQSSLTLTHEKPAKLRRRKLKEEKKGSVKFKYLTREQAKIHSGQEMFLPWANLTTQKGVNDTNTILAMHKKVIGFTKLTHQEKLDSVKERLETFLDAHEEYYEEIVNRLVPEEIAIDIIGNSSGKHCYQTRPGLVFSTGIAQETLDDVGKRDALRQSLVSELDDYPFKFEHAPRLKNKDQRQVYCDDLKRLGLTYYLLTRISRGRLSSQRVYNFGPIIGSTQQTHECKGWDREYSKITDYVGFYVKYPYFNFDLVPTEFEPVKTLSKAVQPQTEEATKLEDLFDNIHKPV